MGQHRIEKNSNMQTICPQAMQNQITDIFSKYNEMHEELGEECGVIGICGRNPEEVSTMLYFGLICLQHRGQEAAGMAVLNERIQYFKQMGLVQDVFTDGVLKRLVGRTGIGHVRYAASGGSFLQNAQPFVMRYKDGTLALAHNGNLVNADGLREELEMSGNVFQTTVDSEVIASMIARNKNKGMDMIEAVSTTLNTIKGAFALTLILDKKLVGARDPLGLRPLVLGKLHGGGYILASESCCFGVIGADFIRDVEPGEIVYIEDGEVRSHFYTRDTDRKICCFEYVYFAMPESTIDGRNVFLSRKAAGATLYNEMPTQADMVVAVPDSGIAAAIGYAEASGIPFDLGLIKNKYMGRTFIEPEQSMRELAVRLKLNVLRENVNGKSIVLIDDSIVRGTTIKRLAGMLKDAGARQVHVRVCSPPVKYSCYYGIDTPSRDNLIAAKHSTDEINEMIGADSLYFISEEGLANSIFPGEDHICTACFNGNYPVKPKDIKQEEL